MVKLLFKRLTNRGYEDKLITPIFNEAAHKIHTKINTKLYSNTKKDKETLQSGNRIFFHLEYHKRDVSRHCIWDAYDSTCKFLGYKGHIFIRYPKRDDTNIMI